MTPADFITLVQEDSGARFLLLVFGGFTIFALAVVRGRRY